MTGDNPDQEGFYAACLSVESSGLPLVTLHHAVWLDPDNPAPKKANLAGKIYYFLATTSSCNTVKELQFNLFLWRRGQQQSSYLLLLGFSRSGITLRYCN